MGEVVDIFEENRVCAACLMPHGADTDCFGRNYKDVDAEFESMELVEYDLEYWLAIIAIGLLCFGIGVMIASWWHWQLFG